MEASPAKAKQVRRFANYYLPDAVNILEQYARLARQGVRGENAAAIRSEVEHNAASIATAFENQLDALYAAESMDLSADLTVLQNMLKGQGAELRPNLPRQSLRDATSPIKGRAFGDIGKFTGSSPEALPTRGAVCEAD